MMTVEDEVSGVGRDESVTVNIVEYNYTKD